MTFCRNEIFQKNKQNKYLFRTFKHKPDCPSLDFIQPWQGLPPCLYHDLSMRLKGTIKTQVITDFKACRPVKLCRTSDKGPFIYTHSAIIYFSHSDRLFCASAVPHSTFPVDFFSCVCIPASASNHYNVFLHLVSYTHSLVFLFFFPPLF